MVWTTSSRLERLPPDWEDRRKAVLIRDKYRCRIRGTNCGFIATEVDHIIRGDNHDLVNLRSVCSSCHRKKSSAEGHQAKAAKKALSKRPPTRHPGRMTT